jgi:hypothetical protein
MVRLACLAMGQQSRPLASSLRRSEGERKDTECTLIADRAFDRASLRGRFEFPGLCERFNRLSRAFTWPCTVLSSPPNGTRTARRRWSGKIGYLTVGRIACAPSQRRNSRRSAHPKSCNATVLQHIRPHHSRRARRQQQCCCSLRVRPILLMPHAIALLVCCLPRYDFYRSLARSLVLSQGSHLPPSLSMQLSPEPATPIGSTSSWAP